MPITPEQLAEWKRLDQNATQWPWHCTTYHGTYEAVRDDYDEDPRTFKIWTVGHLADDENWNTDSACPGYGMKYADARVAAEARNALPVLIAEVERLQEDLRQLQFARAAAACSRNGRVAVEITADGRVLAPGEEA